MKFGVIFSEKYEVPQDVYRFFLGLFTGEWQQIAHYLGYSQHFLDSLLNHMHHDSRQAHVSGWHGWEWVAWLGVGGMAGSGWHGWEWVAWLGVGGMAGSGWSVVCTVGRWDASFYICVYDCWC